MNQSAYTVKQGAQNSQPELLRSEVECTYGGLMLWSERKGAPYCDLEHETMTPNRKAESRA